MPRSSRMRSALGVVGSFAPSTTTLQSMTRALASLVITPPSAAGTSQSQGMVQSCSLAIAFPAFHSDTGFRAAVWAKSPGMSRPLSFTIPPATSDTAMTFAPASPCSNRARCPPTLPNPWMTTRLPLSGMPKSRAYSVITYMMPRPVVLDAVPGEHLDPAVIHANGHFHLDLAERAHEDAPHVRVEIDEIGSALELTLDDGLPRHRGARRSAGCGQWTSGV